MDNQAKATPRPWIEFHRENHCPYAIWYYAPDMENQVQRRYGGGSFASCSTADECFKFWEEIGQKELTWKLRQAIAKAEGR